MTKKIAKNKCACGSCGKTILKENRKPVLYNVNDKHLTFVCSKCEPECADPSRTFKKNAKRKIVRIRSDKAVACIAQGDALQSKVKKLEAQIAKLEKQKEKIEEQICEHYERAEEADKEVIDRLLPGTVYRTRHDIEGDDYHYRPADIAACDQRISVNSWDKNKFGWYNRYGNRDNYGNTRRVASKTIHAICQVIDNAIAKDKAKRKASEEKKKKSDAEERRKKMYRN